MDTLHYVVNDSSSHRRDLSKRLQALTIFLSDEKRLEIEQGRKTSGSNSNSKERKVKSKKNENDTTADMPVEKKKRKSKEFKTQARESGNDNKKKKKKESVLKFTPLSSLPLK